MLNANATPVVSFEENVSLSERERLINKMKDMCMRGEAETFNFNTLILSDGTEIYEFSGKAEGFFKREIEGSRDVHVILTGGIIINFDEVARNVISTGV